MPIDTAAERYKNQDAINARKLDHTRQLEMEFIIRHWFKGQITLGNMHDRLDTMGIHGHLSLPVDTHRYNGFDSVSNKHRGCTPN